MKEEEPILTEIRHLKQEISRLVMILEWWMRVEIVEKEDKEDKEDGIRRPMSGMQTPLAGTN